MSIPWRAFFNMHRVIRRSVSLILEEKNILDLFDWHALSTEIASLKEHSALRTVLILWLQRPFVL